MNIFLCLLALLAYGAAQQPCCSPSQFEAVIGYIGGFFVPSTGRNDPIDMYALTSYDFTNQRLAQEVHNNVPVQSEFRQILDFRARKSYVIVGETCVVTPLGGPMARDCLPNNATFLGAAYFGRVEAKLTFNAFEYKWAQGDFTAKVTVTDNCIPITDGMYGEISGEQIARTAVFSDFTLGIKNSSVFQPPASCSQGKLVLPHYVKNFHKILQQNHHKGLF